MKIEITEYSFFDDKIGIKLIKLIIDKLFFIEDPGKLCRLPYPGHPKGCPNWDKSPNCPPRAPKLGDKYDLSKESFFVVNPFNIGEHKKKMKSAYPEWSDKQCACCLYWQNGVRKKLKEESQNLCRGLNLLHPELKYDFNLIPEAMGVDIFKTAEYHNIAIERNPQNILYKVAFVGVIKIDDHNNSTRAAAESVG